MLGLNLTRILDPWVNGRSSGGGLGIVVSTLFASNIFDINAGDTWSVIVGSAFSSLNLDSRLSLTEDSCIIGNIGNTPITNLLVQMLISVESVGGAVAGTSGAAIDYNGDLVGTAMQSNASSAAGAQESDLPAGGAICIPTARLITSLAPGETIRPVMAKFTNIDDFNITGMYLILSQ